MPFNKPFKNKAILDKMNQQKQLITKVNQWKSTLSVIEWFNNFENKEWLSFMVFDIEKFYHSISENLFIKANQLAKKITEITDEDIHLIMQAEKTFYSMSAYHGLKKIEMKILMSRWVASMAQRYVN